MADAFLTALTTLTPRLRSDWLHDAGMPMRLPFPGRPVANLAAMDPWFDAARDLPGVKHRYLNNTTRYGLAATLACLRMSGNTHWRDADEERRGVYLGTAVADYAVRRQVDQAVLAAGAKALNTVSAPNISANIAAAHLAIASRSRAFATTLPSPLLAGFEGLYLAVQALQMGRIDTALSIAAEETVSDADGAQVMPGAVVLQLHSGHSGGGRRIAATAWGSLDDPALAARGSTGRLLKQAGAFAGIAQLVVLRDASETGAACATCWLRWLNAAGMSTSSRVELAFSSIGAVEPLLWAAYWLTQDRPILLIAIHQRRYLAFLSTP
ncbi:beta-ketoacyl synthase N-terminal-like domain-containing protein [Cupriavidus basilensis]|uniref:beta-ketoacyl synthase N-terminal-like domain-containing protein n=1 Tax=Cupriavidus basilensis TaxID=68895 RepID=UPI0023E7A998|nr:beta-ketoacyl synthase N-terminal-like domain-containing protein [Cupriavidus basilensis]